MKLTQQMHKQYSQGSPLYRDILHRYGRKIDLETARSIAGRHGFSASDLECINPIGKTDALALVMELGY